MQPPSLLEARRWVYLAWGVLSVVAIAATCATTPLENPRVVPLHFINGSIALCCMVVTWQLERAWDSGMRKLAREKSELKYEQRLVAGNWGLFPMSALIVYLCPVVPPKYCITTFFVTILVPSFMMWRRRRAHGQHLFAAFQAEAVPRS